MQCGNDDGQKGQALVVLVMALGVLMGIMALVIDGGMAFQQRRSLQNAVDAAALAGARELPADPALAEVNARTWAASNGITEADELVVEISSSYVPNDTITVHASSAVTSQFATV